MNITSMLALSPIGLVSMLATPLPSPGTAIEPMPAALETRFALSALPPAMREQATVFLLDPRQGYRLARRGTRRRGSRPMRSLSSPISAPFATCSVSRARSSDGAGGHTFS